MFFGLQSMRKTLIKEVSQAIKSWDKTDIYAISLFVYDNCDNPCEPTVTLGYNTLTQYNQELPNASSEQEAKWNYAYWIQNNEYCLGFEDNQKIVRKWLKNNGFPYYTSNEVFDRNNNIDSDELEKITDAFINELIEVVKELHNSGFIKNQFGKDIPVLIHELEYYDKIAEQNLKANPPETVKDFVKFCCGE